MAHPPTPCHLEVDPDDVLWFTRGNDWDYAFVLKPPLRLDDDWHTLQWKIFRDLQPESYPQYVAGTVWRGGVAHGFLATLFRDPVRKDPDGLPVTHRLVWFPPDESTGRIVAPAGWGARFVEALGPALDAVTLARVPQRLRFNHAAAVHRLMAVEIKPIARPLRLEGPAVMIYVDQDIVAKVRRLADTTPRISDVPARQPTRLELALIGSAIVAVIFVLLFLAARRP